MRSGDDIRINAADAENIAVMRRSRDATMRDQARRVLILAAVCALVLLAGMLTPTFIFDPFRLVESSPAEFLYEFSNRFSDLVSLLTGGASNGFDLIFCTYIIAAVSGGALGMCGSVYQGALRNPLAAPKTLGVMSGGALGALMYELFLKDAMQNALSVPPMVAETPGVLSQQELNDYLAQLNPLQWMWFEYGECLVSVLGCFSIVAVVLLIASFLGHGKLSNITLIIAGQVFSVAVTGLILFCRYYFTQNGDAGMAEEMRQIENYALGGTYMMQDLVIICVPLGIMMAATLLMRNKLTMLSFGDEEAQSMGVNVNRWRYGMVAICTAMTGWAISFAGHVAFLGFISAHTARKIVGPDMRYLLPASMFVGAIFITAFYMLSTVGLPFAPRGSVGMYTSIVGAAVFLVLALRQRGKGSGDWT